MKGLLKLVLRSQTVLGLIPLLVLVMSDFAIFGFQQSNDDREAFHCVRLNVSTEQRCYDNYTSEQGLKFYVMFMLDGFVFVFWIFVMVKSTLVLRTIKHNRLIQNDESQQSVNSRLNWPPDKFRIRQLSALGCQLFCVGITTIWFCFQYFIDSKFKFSFPGMYNCSMATDTIPVRFNQTFSCHDQHYKEKANFNIATVVIRLFIMILCTVNFIYIVKTLANKLLDKLLGDVMEESGSNLQGENNSLRKLHEI